MAADFGIGTAANVVAANVAGPIIDVVVGKMKDVIEMGENVGHLKTDFTRMQGVLERIENQFREQQRALPEPVQNCLERIRDDLQGVEDLIDDSEPQPWCLGCCFLRNPKLSTQIRDWKTGFDRLFEELEREFSLCADTTQIVAAAPLQLDALRLPVSVSRFVGSAIESAQEVQAWLGEAHPQARMVGIYGMGGVGKTSILELIYNHFKEVTGNFDAVIWLTISRKYKITNLQASMAETLNLNLKGISDKDIRKMKLSASLRGKKFLLILDDLWHPIDLTEIGVTFEDAHNCSKVLMSSRSSDVIGQMGASAKYSLEIKHLTTEEGLRLFRREAFTNWVVVPNESIQGIAREIAMECQGLPLALIVVARAMRLKSNEDQWKRALKLMSKVDPSFRISIDEGLYKRLKWSYDELANRELKICFLYCAVFPEDANIDVEELVQMWSAEKLVTDMDAGLETIDALVGKGLFEYVSDDRKRVKVHDILHDLAIYIGRSENCLFAPAQDLQDFPIEGEIRHCRRISVGHNDICVLPTSLACPKLVSLVLACTRITEVKEGFLSAAMSLKVLDLSCTNITTLPTSLGQLEQLEFLNLSGCSGLQTLPESIGNLSSLRFLKLEGCTSLNLLPDSIGNLSSLRFLNLEGCASLNSYPDNIGNLRNLKHLNLEGCDSLMAIPHGISHITSLNQLFLPVLRSCAINVEYIANLSNLMELTAAVKCENKESTMTTWTELRRLEVSCVYDADRDDVGEEYLRDDADRDDVGEEYLRDDPDRDDVGEEHIFPFNMDNLNKLEHFTLRYYQGVSLPNCIPQLQNLRELELVECLPGIVAGGFPMLKSLKLELLMNLESMMVMGSPGLSGEETMPQLEDIHISCCSSLKRLRTRKLPRLKKLWIEQCSEFEALEIESCGLPMLEDLMLRRLDKCETIVGPSGVINDGVMPKLQRLNVSHCPLLRRLVLEKLSNLWAIGIYYCNELRELAGGFPALEALVLYGCPKVENMVGPYDVWDENTMPQLRALHIVGCPLLRTLPRGMEKLSRLQQIIGAVEWWKKLIWEDENVKNSLFPLFIKSIEISWLEWVL